MEISRALEEVCVCLLWFEQSSVKQELLIEIKARTCLRGLNGSRLNYRVAHVAFKCNN